MSKHGYGWQRDLPDARDLRYSAPLHVLRLPAVVDLRPDCPPVYDQGQLGSCTANAIDGALQFERMKQSLANASSLVPARLFIYWNEREIEGTVNSDSGAQLRDGMKTVATQGACFESGADAWPYNISKFKTKPPADCYTAAKGDEAIEYLSITPSVEQLQGCLASGYPFVFGFTVYESFESSKVEKTGVVPMPKKGERVLGGHAVAAVGYDASKATFTIRNSWGPDWGMEGYCTMPAAYLSSPKLASDFWTIRSVN